MFYFYIQESRGQEMENNLPKDMQKVEKKISLIK